MQQYCRCLLPGLNDNQVVALLKSRGGFIFEASETRTSSQIFSERRKILYVLFVYGTCCEFVARSGRTLEAADAKFKFWWGWCAGVCPGSVFKVNSNVRTHSLDKEWNLTD